MNAEQKTNLQSSTTDACGPEAQFQTREEIGRRSFLMAGVAIGASALSYGRIIGANDRISLGQVGMGRRGREIASVVADLKHSHNFEMTAVCDLWKENRERAAKRTEEVYGRAPRSPVCVEDLLELKDVDAVIISTADFQH